MPNSRARTPAQMKRRNQIQKAYVGNNNRVKPTTAKTPRKNFARGTRRSQKLISNDDQIDETIVKIGEAIEKLNRQLSEFVTKKELNARLVESERKILDRYAEGQVKYLHDQIKNAHSQPLRSQESTDSGLSYGTAELFRTIPNKKSQKK